MQETCTYRITNFVCIFICESVTFFEQEICLAFSVRRYSKKIGFTKYPGKIIVEFLKPIKPGLEPGEFRKKLKNIL